MTILGVYFAPTHGRQSDRDYIAALQPPVIRLLDPDAQQIADMHALAPNAIIAPRSWAIDDNDGAAVRALVADPIGTGRNHAQQYRGQLDRWQSEADRRRLVLPSVDRILFNAANEPNQGSAPDKIAAYTVAFINRCTELGIRAAALCLGVGWPDNTGPDTPVNWTPYSGIVEPIRRNGGCLELHEYYYKTGPQDGWRWLAGRHLQCPFDVPILLGEVGIDNFVDKDRWTSEGGNRGWVGNVEPNVYAEMIGRHIRGSDKRVFAALPFITDFRDGPTWFSFDTAAAHSALLARKDGMIPQSAPAIPVKPQAPQAYIPVASGPQAQPGGAPVLMHPVADARYRVVTQRWGENPDYYKQYSVDGVPLRGHNGQDFGAPIGTKIVAVDDGAIVETAFDPDGYGTYVKIRHAWGESLYAHLNNRAVDLRSVRRGELVGLSGDSGKVTGAHLHFGLRVAPFNRQDGWGGYTDPAPYLAGRDAPAHNPQEDIWAIVRAAAAEFDVDADLFTSLVMAESSGRADAVSPAGAKGLGQITDPTWAEWSARIGAGRDPYNPRQNARVGAAFLRWCLDQTGSNRIKALVAYNWGLGNLRSGAEIPLETRIYAYSVIHGADLLKALT